VTKTGKSLNGMSVWRERNCSGLASDPLAEIVVTIDKAVSCYDRGWLKEKHGFNWECGGLREIQPQSRRSLSVMEGLLWNFLKCLERCYRALFK